MSPETTETGSASPEPRGTWSLPGSALAWWAVGLTVAIFPLAYVLMSHLIEWPILDTAFAPLLLVALIDSAAAAAFVAVVRRRERSVLAVAALVIAVPLALFGTAILLLHVIFPD